jgi:hypothetical protein
VAWPIWDHNHEAASAATWPKDLAMASKASPATDLATLAAQPAHCQGSTPQAT